MRTTYKAHIRLPKFTIPERESQDDFFESRIRGRWPTHPPNPHVAGGRDEAVTGMSKRDLVASRKFEIIEEKRFTSTDIDLTTIDYTTTSKSFRVILIKFLRWLII